MTSETIGNVSAARGRRSTVPWRRLALLLFGPLVIAAVGGYFYLMGGRYVSTDDAYVHADNTMISTDVPGRVVEVAVHENERVKAGQVLFKLDDAPYRYALDRATANLATTRLTVDAMRATFFQRQADVKAAQDTLDFTNREFERQRQLVARGNASQQRAALDIRTASIDTIVGTLSGGNQQKVVLAKWLSMKPRLVIFDEPTRGIDVGSKSEIYRLMRGLADAGVAVLMISSDMEEVIGVSDRIVVMREGGIAGFLERAEFSEENVMRLAVGQRDMREAEAVSC